MARYKFVEIECDGCGFNIHDKTFTPLIKRLRKAGWKISKEEDLCPDCVKAPICNDCGNIMTEKYGGGYYCKICENKKLSESI